MQNVNLMMQFLKNASELERFVLIWENALTKINNSLNSITSKQKNLEGDLYSNVILSSCIDDDIAEEKKKSKKDNLETVFIFGPLITLFFLFVYGAPFIMNAFEESRANNISFMEGLTNYIDKEFGAFGIIIICLIVFAIIIFIIATVFVSIKNLLSKSEKDKWDKLAAEKKNTATNERKLIQQKISSLEINERNLKIERNNIQFALNSARKELQDLYNLNILPRKYQNIVATTTMYEYLVTGRCTKIEGHGGMIDTYEYDTKLGVIINNLVEINAKLDVIQRNQEMLYNELCIANQHLSKIEKDIISIENNTGEIKRNTAISAANSQQMLAIARSAEWRTWANSQY